MGGRKLREIVEEETFERSRKKLKADPRQLDRALWAVTWALARDAERASVEVPGTVVRVILTDPFPDVPALAVFLTLTDDEVQLRWIEPENADAEG